MALDLGYLLILANGGQIVAPGVVEGGISVRTSRFGVNGNVAGHVDAALLAQFQRISAIGGVATGVGAVADAQALAVLAAHPLTDVAVLRAIIANPAADISNPPPDPLNPGVNNHNAYVLDAIITKHCQLIVGGNPGLNNVELNILIAKNSERGLYDLLNGAPVVNPQSAHFATEVIRTAAVLANVTADGLNSLIEAVTVNADLDLLIAANEVLIVADLAVPQPINAASIQFMTGIIIENGGPSTFVARLAADSLELLATRTADNTELNILIAANEALIAADLAAGRAINAASVQFMTTITTTPALLARVSNANLILLATRTAAVGDIAALLALNNVFADVGLLAGGNIVAAQGLAITARLPGNIMGLAAPGLAAIRAAAVGASDAALNHFAGDVTVQADGATLQALATNAGPLTAATLAGFANGLAAIQAAAVGAADAVLNVYAGIGAVQAHGATLQALAENAGPLTAATLAGIPAGLLAIQAAAAAGAADAVLNHFLANPAVQADPATLAVVAPQARAGIAVLVGNLDAGIQQPSILHQYSSIMPVLLPQDQLSLAPHVAATGSNALANQLDAPAASHAVRLVFVG